MKMSALMAEKCNTLSRVVNIVYGCFVIMYCKFNLLSVYHCINKDYQK